MICDYKNPSWVWGWEKSVPRITDWRHEACPVMTNGDQEGRFFLSILTRIINCFSCSPLSTAFYIRKTWKRLPENLEYAEMRHGDVIFNTFWRHFDVTDWPAADVRLFVFLSFPLAVKDMWDRIISHLSHMGKNIGNPDLVCENSWSDSEC